MSMENHNLSKLLDGTPGYSSTKLIICEGRSTLTGWRAARSLRSTTGVVSGKASRSGTSSKAYPIRWDLSGEPCSIADHCAIDRLQCLHSAYMRRSLLELLRHFCTSKMTRDVIMYGG